MQDFAKAWVDRGEVSRLRVTAVSREITSIRGHRDYQVPVDRTCAGRIGIPSIYLTHNPQIHSIMKLKSSFVLCVLALAACSASAATRVFDITGATAFRSSANNAIIQLLGGTGVTRYAFTGTGGISGTNRAIFVGTMAQFPGDTIIVRASWSGSTQGIKDVADQNPIEFLDSNVRLDGTPGPGNPVTTAGYNLGGSGLDTAEFVNAVPQWSFSDVDKLLSDRPNHAFSGGPLGVVPFMFLAGEGAPAGLTNMSDQLHNALWSTGQLPIAFFTGNTSDDTVVLATGRNNGSGTRATILSETQYGAFTNVTQFGATFQGTRTDAYPTGKLLALTEFGNGGNSSNSGVRELLTRRADDLTYNGSPIKALFVSYLTISDALAAKTEGAVELTYNGIPFSAANVKNGRYTLWGYQQFYLDNDATAAQVTFDTAFRTAVPATLDGVSAIPLTDMSVVRSGGDGGPVAPGANYPAP